jgi:chromosome segregation ATPase
MSSSLIKLAVALVTLALIGWYAHRMGANSVMAQWSKERQVQTEKLINEERQARAEERRRAKEAQRIIVEAAEAERTLLARAARAERTVGSLRDEIARLNARPAPASPQAASYFDEAGVARELLGACAEEYRGLAAEADGLRNQVTGLQQWVGHVYE